MEWTKGNKKFTSLDDFDFDTVGFVYKITHNISGEAYIGKKILFHKKTLKPLKGYKRKRVKHVESDWLTYTGSNETTKQWNCEECTREILELCVNKTMMTYYEVKYQFKLNVLEDDNYLNGNILGKFHSATLKKYLK